ncbi:hypothetical protein Tco_0450457 [Tanacetum coccineum]
MPATPSPHSVSMILQEIWRRRGACKKLRDGGSDVNPYHRRCRGRDVRDAVMGGGWTPDLVVVRGSGGGFIIAGGGGSPPNMVVDGDLGSGGVGDAVVVGGHCGVLVIGGGGRPHDMVGDMVDCGTSGSHLDDALPA